MIKSVYRNYFQKSRVFLYPVLGIDRGSSVTPVNTYLSWENCYSLEDKKLICVFHLREDSEYKAFEKKKLFNNPLFHDFFETTDKLGVYVFDYSTFASDWDLVLAGKYSQLSSGLQTAILSYYAKYPKDFSYINSYLNPEIYFDIYADLLKIDPSVIRSVGELCDKPDLFKELLKISIKNLDYLPTKR
jgi:hypothetical protein